MRVDFDAYLLACLQRLGNTVEFDSGAALPEMVVEAENQVRQQIRKGSFSFELTAAAIAALTASVEPPPENIDLLACGTSSPDQTIPGHASMVHGLLGCPPCEIVSTAGVCCSSMAALKCAYLSVETGAAHTAIVTGSDLVSPALRASQFGIPSEEDERENPYLGFNREFLRFMLSDGAGAVLLEPKVVLATECLKGNLTGRRVSSSSRRDC